MPIIPIPINQSSSKVLLELARIVERQFGAMMLPLQTIWNARAERTKAIIEATTKIEIADIKHLAASRRQLSELRETDNLLGIVQKAIEMLPGKESIIDETVGDDWQDEFFDAARGVSDREMQMLWARILAGEIIQPGSFSRRTLAMLRTMSKEEATSFADLCCFLFHTPSGRALILKVDAIGEWSESSRPTIPFEHLSEIGLLLSPRGALVANMESGLRYHDVYYSFKIDNADVAVWVLTAVGLELSKIANPQKKVGFDEYVMRAYKHAKRITEKEFMAKALEVRKP